MLDLAILSPAGRSGEPRHGGITPVVCRLANALTQISRSVELVTLAPGDPRPLLPELAPEVSIHNLGRSSHLAQLWHLRRYLAHRAPRVLLAAGHRPNLLACRMKRWLHPPTRILISAHNTLEQGLGELSPRRRARRLAEIRRNYPAAEGIVCVSGGVAEELARLAPNSASRIQVVHNPIVTAALLSAGQSPVEHPWFRDGQPTVILGVGRLTRQKDFVTLIRAFALIQKQCDCRLVILGEGSEREPLQRLAYELRVAEWVDLPGFVANPFAYMARAGVFVLSSLWEGFGNVLVEAMAMGTPVVSTDCPSGPREILRDGALGPLVPTGDPERLGAAMLDTLSRPADRGALKERALDFSADRVAARYQNLLFAP